MTVAPRPSADAEQPDVPAWALAAGFVVVAIFAGLVIQTFTGRPLLARLSSLVPGAGGARLAGDGSARAFYVPGDTVQPGQVGLGARGQDRAFQVGDLVLLGEARRLVRIEDGGRLTDIRVAEGTTVTVASLGAWDASAGGLAGLSARYAGGAWTVDGPSLDPAGPPLHPRDAPEDELPLAFRLVPASAGRVRRTDTQQGPVIRVRPSGRAPSLVLEGREPLSGLDDATVTVLATVRASEGATLELALDDAVDAAGTVQRTADRRTAADEDTWTTLRVQRRVSFAAPDDRYSVGLVEVRNRDWLEVRSLDVYLGALP
jgi:hypothetical protein